MAAALMRARRCAAGVAAAPAAAPATCPAGPPTANAVSGAAPLGLEGGPGLGSQEALEALLELEADVGGRTELEHRLAGVDRTLDLPGIGEGRLESRGEQLQDLADLVAVRKGLSGYRFYPLYAIDLSTVAYT